MNKYQRYPEGFREKAIQMVQDIDIKYSSQWQAIKAVAEELEMIPHTLQNWVRNESIESSAETIEAREIRRAEKNNKKVPQLSVVLDDKMRAALDLYKEKKWQEQKETGRRRIRVNDSTVTRLALKRLLKKELKEVNHKDETSHNQELQETSILLG
jgi:transposase